MKSPAYLDKVRAQPCCACGRAAPSNTHYYGRAGNDLDTVPLCNRCVGEFERSGMIRPMEPEETTKLFAFEGHRLRREFGEQGELF